MLSSIAIVLFATVMLSVDAAPQRRQGNGGNGGNGNGRNRNGNGNGNGNGGNTAAAAPVPGGAPIITQATDGSTIMDKMVMIKYILVNLTCPN